MTRKPDYPWRPGAPGDPFLGPSPEVVRARDHGQATRGRGPRPNRCMGATLHLSHLKDPTIMKTARLGSLKWSKVICGSNPFNAHSHFSAACDAEYRARFTDEGIGHVLHRCLELGDDKPADAFAVQLRPATGGPH